MPAPAVIHWVEPSVSRPPPPVESLCSKAPSSMYVTVSKPRCALGLTGRVLDRTHVVEKQERVGQAQVHARERTAYDETLAFELALCRDDLAHAAPVGRVR